MNKQAIPSGDPLALENPNKKMESCQKRQAYMKEVNAYFRKHETCSGFPDMTDATAAKLDLLAQNSYSWEKRPFPSYELLGNRGEIKKLQKRIEELTRDRE